ncbi:MAG: ankyrin repeat domain-containing protein [Acidobacteriaceae bacterium]
MSIRELPARPNLEHLKNQARKLLRQALALDAEATARFAAAGVSSSPPKLAAALHVIAREHGFDTWPALKLHVSVGSEDPAEALAAAIQANDAKVVREVLERHSSLREHIDEPLEGIGFDSPALLGAVHRNNREMVDALLDAGADINTRSRWWAGGFGVLDSAGQQMAEHLIARGATVDIHAAARLGTLDRVRELLEHDPELVHARGGDGQLPLHFAATVEIASLLVEYGAEMDARDIDHESTAAQYMVCARQYMGWREPYRHDVARFLISRGAQTDILMASAIGDVVLVEQILNNDPETIRTTVTERSFPKRDPRSGGSIYFFGFGMTKSPHMIARQFGHTAVFDLLMQRSAPWLRLVQAAETGNEEFVREIVRKHPGLFTRLSANAARRIIGTALRSNARAVELLLEQGWPANPALDNGQTALHFAAWHGNLGMVRALLGHNADVNVLETEHGGSPLEWALHGSVHSWEREKGDYLAVARALLAAGATVPNLEHPLEGSDEVLEVVRRYE